MFKRGPRPRLWSPTGKSPSNVNTCSPESVQEIINQKTTRCKVREGELAALFIYFWNHYYRGVVSALNNKLVSRLFTARARNQHVLLLPLTCPSTASFFFSPSALICQDEPLVPGIETSAAGSCARPVFFAIFSPSSCLFAILSQLALKINSQLLQADTCDGRNLDSYVPDW